MATYTVKRGDTLSEIAWKYNSTYHYGSTVKAAYMRLAEINDIDNPNHIVVGQVLKLDNPKNSDGSDKKVPKGTSKGSAVVIKAFGLQSDTDRTIYVSWTWTKTHTQEYRVVWYYSSGDGVWFVGSDSKETFKQSVYTAPTNAERVKVKIKPISKKHKVKKKQVSYWTAKWSTEKQYDFSYNPPAKLSAPTVSVSETNKNKLTADVDNIDPDWTGDYVIFQVVQNDKTVTDTVMSKVVLNRASCTTYIFSGNSYKVRCRGVNKLKSGDVFGEWSDYSSDIIATPAAPGAFIKIKALTHTSVSLDWPTVKHCTSYELQYTTQKRYFDSNPNEVKSQTVESVVSHAEVSGLETGSEYFFRVRAVNSAGSSAWNTIKSIKLGIKPSAPTTWSSTTTAMVGETLSLYWVHNAEDGSSQTYAELELNIGGKKTTKTIKNTTNEDKKDLTSVYNIDTSKYEEGVKINWRVRTKGVIDTYSDWSATRSITIYAEPWILLKAGGDTLSSFPLSISGFAYPETQTAIGWHISIVANKSYRSEDQVGNSKLVRKGDAVYSKYFNTKGDLGIKLGAGDVDLERNVSYTINVTVSMNSGLTAKAKHTFKVSWLEEEWEPDAEIGYDDDTYTVRLRPYCVDDNDELISTVTLSVYRRQYDGEFVEIASGIKNTKRTYVTDPHPSLDYARYRIVATDTSTGAVTYCDLPGYPIDEPAVIIQWNEEWSNFDVSSENEEDDSEEPDWAGSLLRIPYNIDVSDKTNPDVSLVKYVGRKRPVSYYGTQLGETSSWKMEIPKNDKDTLYTIRRLAIWMGDVYVREPSGSGYWANINVSYSQTHNNLTIPVTFDITRVEGGA